jgi:hypothetical protein
MAGLVSRIWWTTHFFFLIAQAPASLSRKSVKGDRVSFGFSATFH